MKASTISIRMNTKQVQTLYTFGHAKWYDMFMHLWIPLVARKAEQEFQEFMKQNCNSHTEILELGSGTGRNLESFKKQKIPFKSYCGIDFSKAMLAIAKRKFQNYTNIEFKEGDISTVKEKRIFDLIICTWVLSHTQNPSEIVNHAQQFLKKNRKMYIICFTKPYWYINTWFYPLAKYLFKMKYVSEKEIQNFQNLTKRRTRSHGMTTNIVLEKSGLSEL